MSVQSCWGFSSIAMGRRTRFSGTGCSEFGETLVIVKQR